MIRQQRETVGLNQGGWAEKSCVDKWNLPESMASSSISDPEENQQTQESCGGLLRSRWPT